MSIESELKDRVEAGETALRAAQRRYRGLLGGVASAGVIAGVVVMVVARSGGHRHSWPDGIWVIGGALVLFGTVFAAALWASWRPRSSAEADNEDDGTTPELAIGDWHVIWPMVVLVAAVGALFLLLTYVFNEFRQNYAFLPENNLPLALISAIIALLLAVAVLAIVFKRLGLADPRLALGLPEGSVRAIIALLLIVLFFVTAIYLYADSSRSNEYYLEKITTAQAAKLPVDKILSQRPDGEGRVTVTLAVPRSAASQDIAKQLVTTVSTLVVAVSAFYFGANSVQTAAASRASNQTDQPAPAAGRTTGTKKATKKAPATKAAAQKTGSVPRAAAPPRPPQGIPPAG